MTTEKPRRRWLRYTLRTLFVVMTLAAIASLVVPPTIAWFLPESNPPSPMKTLPWDIFLKRDPNGQVTMCFGDRPVDEAYLRRVFPHWIDLSNQGATLSVDKGIPDGEVATVVDQLVRLGLKKRLIITKSANSQTMSP